MTIQMTPVGFEDETLSTDDLLMNIDLDNVIEYVSKNTLVGNHQSPMLRLRLMIKLIKLH